MSAETQAQGGISDLAKQEERLAYMLLLPSFLILLLIAIYPLGSVVYYSFTDKQFASAQPTEFVGLDNYANLLSITVREVPPETDDAGQIVRDDAGNVQYVNPLQVLPRQPRSYRTLTEFNLFGTQYAVGATDRDFINSVRDTVFFTIVAVTLETILGLGVALVVNTAFPGRGPMRTVMLIPWAIPTAVSSKMWEFMFASTRIGFFNVVFQRLGLVDQPIAWLENDAWQLPSMIAIDVWKTTPFMALLLLAGLQLISNDMYEAAEVDGANKFRQFWSITLPLLRPTLAVALIFRTLDTLRVFDVFQIVLGQSRFTMASFTYFELISNRAMGYSAAASVVIFIIIAIFAVLYLRLLGVETA